MQRTFIKNLLFLLFLNLLIKPIWILVVDVEVQNTVGHEEFGSFYVLLSFAMLFNILLDPGINNFINRKAAQSPTFLRSYFIGTAFIKLVVGFIYIGVVWLAGTYVMDYSLAQLDMLYAISIVLFLQSVLLYVRANLAGLHLFKIDSLLSITDRTLMILLCGYLLWWAPYEPEFKMIYYVGIQGFGYSVAILIGVIAILMKARFKWQVLNLKETKAILMQSFPFALLTLIMAAYYKIDTVMLNQMLEDGAAQAGIYAQGYKIPEAGIMFAYLFSTLLYPIFSRMLAKKDNVQPLLETASTALLIPLFFVLVLVSFYREEVISFLYVNEVIESANVLKWLIGTFVMVGLSYITGTLLTANGSLKQLNVIAGAGLVVNLVLNWFLIPTMKAEGSAIATLVTQIIVVAAQILVIRKVLGADLSMSIRLRMFVFLIILVGGTAIAKDSFERWYLQILIAIVIGGAALLSMKIIRRNQIQSLLSLLKQK